MAVKEEKRREREMGTITTLNVVFKEGRVHRLRKLRRQLGASEVNPVGDGM